MNNYNIGNNRPKLGDYSLIIDEDLTQASYVLGAHLQGNYATFAVYSQNASCILLEIYEQATGVDAKYDYWLVKNPQDQIWRAKIQGIKSGTFYAFRCWGPNWRYHPDWHRGNSILGYITDVDQYGNRFNPNKVIYDPYTREISHDKETPAMLQAGHHGGMYATGGGNYQGVVSREYDTGKWVPKGIVISAETTNFDHKPFLTPEKAIIYEAHVRGLTQHPSATRLETILKGMAGFEGVKNVPEAYRGTYRGAGYMAKYLKALGFTTIELLPVQETANDANPEDHPGGNYWGYMTFGYFAPDRHYAYDQSPGGPTREFKEMIQAFHREGLEVYLDVVYNHSGEGGNWGSPDVTGFVSFGGFDAAQYYQLTDNGFLVDGATGCGNQFNFSHEVCRNLVLDSLSYWLTEMGVDGFRFDLAPVLGRTPNEFERENWGEQKRFFQEHPLLQAIRDLGEAHQAEMIAEAWDIWGYEVGNFPSGWGEWNGRYRDAVRRFLKGDGNTPDFMERVNGDYHNFNDQGGPQCSINFLVAHDGFTLADLVSYNQKNNQNSWPFGPSDGGCDDNNSWDSGGNQDLRRQRLRSFWTIQFLSRGLPMVVWGDELGRTQNGNNNPYNIDSVATWNNYDMIASRSPHQVATGYPDAYYHNNLGTGKNEEDRNPIFIFSHYITQLRLKHPALKQRKYADLVLDSGDDVTYLFTKCNSKEPPTKGDRALTLLIDGSAVGDTDFLVLINMYHSPITFSIPIQEGNQWVRIIDTSTYFEPEYNCWHPSQATLIADSYELSGFAIAVLQEVKLS